MARRRDWMDSRKVGMRSCGVFGSGRQNWRSGNPRVGKVISGLTVKNGYPET